MDVSQRTWITIVVGSALLAVPGCGSDPSSLSSGAIGVPVEVVDEAPPAANPSFWPAAASEAPEVDPDVERLFAGAGGAPEPAADEPVTPPESTEPSPEPEPVAKPEPTPEPVDPSPAESPVPESPRPEPATTEPASTPLPLPLPEPEPEPEPEPAPKPEPEVRTAPEPKPKPKPEPDPEPEPTRPRPAPALESESPTAAAPKPEPDPKPKPDPKPASKPEPKSVAAPTPEPAPEPTVEPAAAPTAAPAAKEASPPPPTRRPAPGPLPEGPWALWGGAAAALIALVGGAGFVRHRQRDLRTRFARALGTPWAGSIPSGVARRFLEANERLVERRAGISTVVHGDEIADDKRAKLVRFLAGLDERHEVALVAVRNAARAETAAAAKRRVALERARNDVLRLLDALVSGLAKVHRGA